MPVADQPQLRRSNRASLSETLYYDSKHLDKVGGSSDYAVVKLSQFLPFAEWIGDLKDRKILRADLIAGITVFTVLVPQSMANAQLADLPPHYGLYAAFLPPIVAALFGSSRHLSTGSVALISLMSAAAIQPLAVPGTDLHISLTIFLALMVGLIQLGLGLARLGALINLLSHPVILGFTNAAAIIIGTSQIGVLFGVDVPVGGSHFVRVWQMIDGAMTAPHLPTVGLSALAFTSMMIAKRFGPSVPSILIGVVATTAVTAGNHLDTGHQILIVGPIPEGLPSLYLPSPSPGVIRALLPAAVTIALVGFVGSISIAKAIATRTRQRVGTNRELLGQGLANVIGSLSQSHTVSGSFVRSAVNFRAGSVTGFSSVVAGLLALLTLLWLTPLFYHLPLATLAAIIVMAVIGLLQVEPIVRAWRIERHDGIVSVAAFVMTLAFAPHLEVGILTGIGLSVILYLYRTMNPRIVVLSKHPDGSLRDSDAHGLETCDHVCVIRFDGSLYFGSAGYFEDKVLERAAEMRDLQFLIVDAEGINQVDATGEEKLVSVVHRLREAGIETLFIRTKMQILDALGHTGSYEEIGPSRFYPEPDQALKHVWNLLNDSEGSDCRRDCPTECPLNRARPTASVPNYRV